MTRVLDASAVVCWLRDEEGSDRIADMLEESEQKLLHVVNLLEVGYIVFRKAGISFQIVLERLVAAGVEFVRELDDTTLARAVDLKLSQAPISLADAVAVAVAVTRGATLVTTDHGELDKVAEAGICQIEFLR
jgi:predicted nucleic acid-binding protein